MAAYVVQNFNEQWRTTLNMWGPWWGSVCGSASEVRKASYFFCLTKMVCIQPTKILALDCAQI